MPARGLTFERFLAEGYLFAALIEPVHVHIPAHGLDFAGSLEDFDRGIDVRQIGAGLLYPIFIEPDREQDLVPLRL